MSRICRYNVKIHGLNKIHDKILKLSFEYMNYRDTYEYIHFISNAFTHFVEQ